MKNLIVTVTLVAFVSGFPKPTKLHYRNLYKPLKTIPPIVGPRIIGGQEAVPNSIPYQVFLEVYGSNSAWYCGASLISQNYILTAAHCGDGAIQVTGILGAHRPLSSEDTQAIVASQDIKIHEDYDSEAVINDIGIVKLLTPVFPTDAIQIVKLPSRSDRNNTYEGARAKLSGWGLTDGHSDQISSVLKFVDVKVISNKECGEYYANILSSIVCTSGDDLTGACEGDSGGPLSVNGVQIGVVSFGAPDCAPGTPSAFTRLTSFFDWIERNSDVRFN